MAWRGDTRRSQHTRHHPHSLSSGRRVRVMDYSDLSSSTTTSTTSSDTTSTSSWSSETQSSDALVAPRRARRVQRRKVYPSVRSWSPIGGPAAHLCSITFCTRAGPLPRRLISEVASHGAAKAEEAAMNLFDTFPHTRWCDPEMAAIEVTFAHAVALTSFRLTTAYCDPSKDPVQWELSGAVDADCPDWFPLHTQEESFRGLPLERSITSATIVLPKSSVSAVKFRVNKVRGTVEEWTDSLREVSIRRRTTLRAEKISPAKEEGKGSGHDSDTVECTFTPQTNHSGERLRRATIARHMEEMCTKGAKRISQHRRQEKRLLHPKGKGVNTTVNSTVSAAASRTSETLYEDALRRRERSAARRQAEEEKGRKVRSGGGCVNSSALACEGLYADAMERRAARHHATPSSRRSQTSTTTPMPANTRRRLNMNRTP